MSKIDDKYYVYLLRCRTDKLYCGICRNISRRLEQHLQGKGAKYTRAFPPEQLVVLFQVSDGRSTALRLEAAIKRLSKNDKLALKQSNKKVNDFYGKGSVRRSRLTVLKRINKEVFKI